MNRFWKWVKNEVGGDRILYLNGAIAEETWFDDEITPQQFRAELISGAGDVTVWINSPGGDVFAAAQIYTMLKEYHGRVTVKIDGMAASAASVIAMAGDEVLMSPVSYMLIHNPATIAIGDGADDLETSPLALKAWNRVWTCFLQIALIPDISETERHIFYISAASGTYIRIGLSYDGENDKNRRASDMADCRSLCIRLMDISEGQSMDAALAFALISNELTILAEKEGLPPQRSQEVYENETKHINDFLRKAS